MSQNAEVIDYAKLSRESIQKLLDTYQLNLTVDEVLTIQNKLLKRPPTLAECVLWSIQGSEHCSYKSTRPHLKGFNTDGPHVILGAKEDAGVVSVATDDAGHRYGIVMSHESHNHPSQIVPYEGAATGVGGNVRDVSCMGAEVIAVADGLRFGDLERGKTHWIHQGVVSGIAGYGNPLGIPNLAGDTYYDAAYNDNCLVTVVTLGALREDDLIHSYAPTNADDYVFILVGKPTDNSGFGGASFASATLEEGQEEQNKGAVQEPNAFLQRHILKANYALFELLKEKQLIDRVGFKDLGAGGVACASVELAETSGFGAEIDLESVPTGMTGLKPEVVLCSETQERFMWCVPRELADMVLHHYNETFDLPKVSQGARAAIVGKLRHDGMYVVNYHGKQIVNAKAEDITRGIVYDRPHVVPTSKEDNVTLPEPTDYNTVLLQLLSHPNIASKKPIYEQYDKQVQGRTVIESGCADAGVMQPFNDDRYPAEVQLTGIALSLDHNPRFNQIDPYWGAVNAVVESVRNIAAVGATPVALTDCLCYGNPEKPEQMGEFVAGVAGIKDACAAITLQDYPDATLPVIAGNVSLYNESLNGAIPPSPMIACLGSLKDVTKALSFDFKRWESVLLLVGERKDECGGSVYYQLHNALGSNLPKPDLSKLSAEVNTLHQLVNDGMILSAHDIADGGVATCIAEMSFANNIGANVTIPGDLRHDVSLFSETGGFVLEVNRDKVKKVVQALEKAGVYVAEIGKTTVDARLQMNEVIDVAVEDARKAWEEGLLDRLL